MLPLVFLFLFSSFFLQNDVEAPAYLRTPGYAREWHHEKYPSDLNVTFDLMLKTFNLYYNSWTIWDKCLIFHMCIPYLKAFLFIPIFYLMTFDLYI